MPSLSHSPAPSADESVAAVAAGDATSTAVKMALAGSAADRPVESAVAAVASHTDDTAAPCEPSVDQTPPVPSCFRGTLTAFVDATRQMVPLAEVRLYQTGDDDDLCAICCQADDETTSTQESQQHGWNPSHKHTALPSPELEADVEATYATRPASKGRGRTSKSATAPAPRSFASHHLCVWGELSARDFTASSSLAHAPTFWCQSSGFESSVLPASDVAIATTAAATEQLTLTLGNHLFLALLAKLHARGHVALAHFGGPEHGPHDPHADAENASSTATSSLALLFPVSLTTACIKLVRVEAALGGVHDSALARRLRLLFSTHRDLHTAAAGSSQGAFVLPRLPPTHQDANTDQSETDTLDVEVLQTYPAAAGALAPFPAAAAVDAECGTESDAQDPFDIYRVLLEESTPEALPAMSGMTTANDTDASNGEHAEALPPASPVDATHLVDSPPAATPLPSQTLSEMLESLPAEYDRYLSSEPDAASSSDAVSALTHLVDLFRGLASRLAPVWPNERRAWEVAGQTDSQGLHEATDASCEAFVARHALHRLRRPWVARDYPRSKEKQKMRFLTLQLHLRLLYAMPCASDDSLVALREECSSLVKLLPLAVDRPEYLTTVLLLPEYAPPSLGTDAWRYESTVTFLRDECVRFDCEPEHNSPLQMLRMWQTAHAPDAIADDKRARDATPDARPNNAQSSTHDASAHTQPSADEDASKEAALSRAEPEDTGLEAFFARNRRASAAAAATAASSAAPAIPPLTRGASVVALSGAGSSRAGGGVLTRVPSLVRTNSTVSNAGPASVLSSTAPSSVRVARSRLCASMGSAARRIEVPTLVRVHSRKTIAAAAAAAAAEPLAQKQAPARRTPTSGRGKRAASAGGSARKRSTPSRDRGVGSATKKPRVAASPASHTTSHAALAPRPPLLSTLLSPARTPRRTPSRWALAPPGSASVCGDFTIQETPAKPSPSPRAMPASASSAATPRSSTRVTRSNAGLASASTPGSGVRRSKRAIGESSESASVGVSTADEAGGVNANAINESPRKRPRRSNAARTLFRSPAKTATRPTPSGSTPFRVVRPAAATHTGMALSTVTGDAVVPIPATAATPTPPSRVIQATPSPSPSRLSGTSTRSSAAGRVTAASSPGIAPRPTRSNHKRLNFDAAALGQVGRALPSPPPASFIAASRQPSHPPTAAASGFVIDLAPSQESPRKRLRASPRLTGSGCSASLIGLSPSSPPLPASLVRALSSVEEGVEGASTPSPSRVINDAAATENDFNLSAHLLTSSPLDSISEASASIASTRSHSRKSRWKTTGRTSRQASPSLAPIIAAEPTLDAALTSPPLSSLRPVSLASASPTSEAGAGVDSLSPVLGSGGSASSTRSGPSSSRAPPSVLGVTISSGGAGSKRVATTTGAALVAQADAHADPALTSIDANDAAHDGAFFDLPAFLKPSVAPRPHAAVRSRNTRI